MSEGPVHDATLHGNELSIGTLNFPEGSVWHRDEGVVSGLIGTKIFSIISGQTNLTIIKIILLGYC